MLYLLLLAGIAIASYGMYKYSAIKRADPQNISLAGFSIPEEAVWIALFLIGLILVIAFIIAEFEEHFISTRDFGL